MNNLLVKNLRSRHLIAPLPADKAQRLADEVLNDLAHMHVYPQSIVFINQAVFFLGQRNATNTSELFRQKNIQALNSRANRNLPALINSA